MPKHDAERFNDFTELEDKSAFTIQGTDFVFIYDSEGGWIDEDGNYYNKDGKPVYHDSDEDNDYNSYDGR